MAITSVGYEGTVSEAQWADLLALAGGRAYGVEWVDHWRVTAGTGDRQVRIAAGKGYGYGVVDSSDAQVTLTLDAVGSGSRWDMIVARRDWGANATTFAKINGSTAKALPARTHTPGAVDEQPIALVRVQSGQSQVQEIVDLRAWGSDGGTFAADELTLQYLDRVGVQIRIGGLLWQRVIDSFGNPTWVWIDTANVIDIGRVYQNGFPFQEAGTLDIRSITHSVYGGGQNSFWQGYLPATYRQKKAAIFSAQKAGVQSLPLSEMTNILNLDLPEDAPAGVYQIIATCSTWCGNAADHYKQVRVGGSSTPGSGTVLPGTGDGVFVLAQASCERTSTYQFTHAGGAVSVRLDAQVNQNGGQARAGSRLQVAYQGSV